MKFLEFVPVVFFFRFSISKLSPVSGPRKNLGGGRPELNLSGIDGP
jgi:hypothetical protein